MADTALGELRALLEPYKLGGLAEAASTFIQKDSSLKQNIPYLMQLLKDTPEYKARYEPNGKGNAARRAAGRAEYDPQTYQAVEAALRSVLYAEGMPRGFYDSDEAIADFIGKDIDAEELRQRIQAGLRAAMNAPQSVRNELEQLYGWNTADLAAYYLDPNQAIDVLKTRTQAATIAAQSRQQAGMALQQAQAEELAQAGVTEQEARAGFGAIAQQQGLFEAQMVGEQAVSQQEQIAGTFGTSAAATQRIATRRRRRQAEFEAGGGFAAGQGGVIGLQSAQ